MKGSMETLNKTEMFETLICDAITICPANIGLP